MSEEQITVSRGWLRSLRSTAEQEGAILTVEAIDFATGDRQPTIMSDDLVIGEFWVRGQSIVEDVRGAWMVHLPSGRGAACADHRSVLQNRVACFNEIVESMR